MVGWSSWEERRNGRMGRLRSALPETNSSHDGACACSRAIHGRGVNMSEDSLMLDQMRSTCSRNVRCSRASAYCASPAARIAPALEPAKIDGVKWGSCS